MAIGTCQENRCANRNTMSLIVCSLLKPVVMLAAKLIIICNNQIERHDSRFSIVSSLRRELSPNAHLCGPGCDCVQIMCNTYSVHHVQHVMCHLV